MTSIVADLSANNKTIQVEKQVDHAEAAAQNLRCAHEILSVIPLLKRITQRNLDGTGYPITVQQYAVLKVLLEQQYLISELANIFKVSRPTMTRIIDGLEGRRRNNIEAEGDGLNFSRRTRVKLVERVDSPEDRRLVYARITEEGEAMVQYYQTRAEENVVLVLKRIPPEDMVTLERSVVLLRLALEMDN